MAVDRSRGVVVVSHAASPSDFYIRLRRDESRLAEFHRGLASAVLDDGATRRSVVPRPGEFYVAAVPANQPNAPAAVPEWRRVLVIDVFAQVSESASSPLVVVQARLVDVGCTKTLLCDALRPFPEGHPTLFTTPAFALACRLMDVVPISSSSATPSWSKVACEYFSSLVTSHPLFLVNLEEPRVVKHEAEFADRAALDLFVGVETKETALNAATSATLRVAQVLVEEELAEWNEDVADSGVGDCSDALSPLPASLTPLGRHSYPRWKPPHFSPPTDVLTDVGILIDGVVRACCVIDGGDHEDGRSSGDDDDNNDDDDDDETSVLFWVFPAAEFPSSTEARLHEAIDEYCRSVVASSPKESIGGDLRRGQAVFVKGEEGHWFRGRLEIVDFDSANPPRVTYFPVMLIDIGVRKLVPASKIIFVVPPPFLGIPQLAYEITMPLERVSPGQFIADSLLEHMYVRRSATFRLSAPRLTEGRLRAENISIHQ